MVKVVQKNIEVWILVPCRFTQYTAVQSQSDPITLIICNLTPLNPLSVRSSVRPAKALLGPKGPSPLQELERSPS